jgi:hypothetical protein
MANEVPVMTKMKQLNTARGRKGAWHRKNTEKWDRSENRAREAEARSRAEFVQDFIFTDTIEVKDVTRMYCGGLVREFPGSYVFELRQAVDDVLGVMSLGRLIN